MSTPNPDPARAAQIDKRMAQTFDFIRDVIDNPELLEKIPDGSRLAFREDEIDGYQLRLTAARRAGTDRQWESHITGHTLMPSALPGTPPLLDLGMVATGQSAEAALDALVAHIHSFRLTDQAIEAVRYLAYLLPRAAKSPYLWKWVVSAAHDAMHGFMALALRGSDGAQLLIPEDEQATYQRWHRERQLHRPLGRSEQRRVDSFLNLYKKIQEPGRMERSTDSRAFTPSPEQTDAVEWLDRYWNELTFYGDTTLGLGVSWFPTMILEVLSVIEWLFEDSNTMTLFPEDEKRASEAILLAKTQAANLAEMFARTPEKTAPQP